MTTLFIVCACGCLLLPVGLGLTGRGRRAVYFAVMVVLLLIGPAAFLQGRSMAALADATALKHIATNDGIDPDVEWMAANITTFGGVLFIVGGIGCLLGGILWIRKPVAE